MATLLVCISVKAQTVLSGSVTDTLNKVSLENAVVYLKHPKDSTLVSFTRADASGKFLFSKLPQGKWIMVVSYPGFADWIDSISTGTQPQHINVALTSKTHILEEVIVRQVIPPIRIKGDTTEYKADSFHVKPGATVEDLLRVLPGISVNSKGEISTQGQKVQKVLVDGDEFFGADPTMATQNLNAKDVDKVQVFDRKSDQATLTGIDDGSKEKTVNLVLKEEAKKGYFGNVTAGTDFDKYYQGKLTASRFTSTLKAGILATADRTGRGGMNWEEMQDYGSISSTVDNGNVMFSWEGDDDFETWGAQGVPESYQVAGMMNKKFGKWKSSTANNIGYNRLNLAGEGSTSTQYILPDTVYYNNQQNATKSIKWKENFSTRNEFNIDSLNTFTVNARGSRGKQSNISQQTGEYLTGNKVRVNNSQLTNSSNGDNNSSKGDLFFRHKFNASGTRSLTVSTGYSQRVVNNEGYLLNKTQFYANGIPSYSQTVDQRKMTSNDNRTYQALVSYTEPISKKMSVNINYTYDNGRNEQDTRSYDRTSAGKYDSLNQLFSNHYLFTSQSHREGITWNYAGKKLTLRAAMGVQQLRLDQNNLNKDSAWGRSFTNLFPNAMIRWKYSGSGNLYLSYYGNTQQPALQQLQPVLNNNDPLNLVTGNPDLRPAFNHSFSLNYSDYKVLSKRSIWGYSSFNFTEHAFANRSVVDSLGRRTTQTVNVEGNFRYYNSIGFSKTIKLLALELGIRLRMDGSRNTSFVNGLKNITNQYSIGPQFSIGKYIEKKLSVDLNFGAQYNNSVSSINKQQVTSYWVYNADNYFDYRFKKGWSLNTNLSWNFRQKFSASDKDFVQTIWNASLEKKISKKKDITGILTVNDILNQRQGFRRDLTSNYITESRNTTVQRYIMFSVRWKFSKNRKPSEDDE
jgi:hypothetical protein